MSQENVEVVRRANDAFDAKDMDALLAEHHPNVEIVVLRSEIEGPYRGHDGLRRMSADNFEANVEVRIDEIRDCGDRVLVLGHQHATVRGARWDHVLAEVYELDDRKITRMQAFPTIEDALEAAGLGKSPMSQENIEIVRLAYAALSEADRDALTELTDSNWVFDFSRSIGPDEGVYRGREQVFRFAATYGEAFERFQLSPIEYVVGPGGEIVVRHQVSAKGRGSGVEWERVPDAAMVWELRDDKVIKTTLYQHHAEAIEAVGLRE